MTQATLRHDHHRSVDELLFWWPTITRKAGNDWAKGFAVSIMAASRRRNWKPSDKQLGIMRRMVSELFTDGNDDVVIEGEG